MIGLIAKVRIREGTAETFEALFRERATNVRKHEPGCLLYQLARSRTEPNTYKVMELFLSNEDIAKNTDTDYFRASRAAFAACTDGPPEIEYLDAVT